MGETPSLSRAKNKSGLLKQDYQNYQTKKFFLNFKFLLKIIVLGIAFTSISLFAQAKKSFTPGTPMRDVDGNLLKAYDGGVTFFNGTYYWYGEFKNGRIETDEIACYSSTDLYN